MNTTFAILIVGALLQSPGGDSSFEGTWGGWANYGGDLAWLQVRARDGALFVDDVGVDLHGARASSFELTDARVRFEYASDESELAFDGTLEGRTLAGQLSEAGAILGDFELTRFHETPADRFRQHLGRYETDAGETLWVVPRTHGGVRVVQHTGAGRRYGDYSFDAWLPYSDDGYFEAVLGEAALPPRRMLEFEGDVVRIRGEADLEARRTPNGSVRTVTLRAGALELHGWLMTPPSAGPHPAIAYAHGSGYVRADSPFDLYTSVRLIRHLDLAVLRWDKRGVWNSRGDQATASYHDLADDVLSAVAWLREQPDVDRDRVGIGGLSQAPSAPLPIAAARSKAVAFVIATSGFVGSPLETNLFNWSNRMRAAGQSEDEIQGLVEFFERLLPYTLDPTPEGQRAYDAFLAEHRDQPWFETAVSFARLEDPLDCPALDRWRKICGVNSADYWLRVTCPVFQSWGVDDPLVDAAMCSERMAALVAGSGQENFTSIVYPSPANHGIGSANTPTFFDDLAAWFERAVR